MQNGRTGAPLEIQGANTHTASFAAPVVTTPATLHIILAVTDRGAPPLTRYRRVIVTVSP